MKLVIGILVGVVLGAFVYIAYSNPKEVFGTFRTGIDKAEQLQIAECRESYISDSQCYQKFKQEECERRLIEKCGKVKK